MSASLAIISALAIHLLVLVPLAASWRISSLGRRVALLYTALAVGTGLYHTGIFHHGSLARTDIQIPIVAVGDDDPRCMQVLEALESAGVDLAASDVNQAVQTIPGWQQVPEAGRQLVLDCIRNTSAE